MSDIKLKAASGGGSISLKGPSSLGSDRDLVDTSGNINLLDSQKLNVGTGNDLKIYHNGTDTFYDSFTGATAFRTQNGDFHFQYYDGSSAESIAVLKRNDACELYYNNSKKLETDSFGVSIQGDCLKVPDGSAGSPGFTWNNEGNADTGIFRPDANVIAFSTAGSERMRIVSGGDVYIGTTTGNTGTSNFGVYFASHGAINHSRDVNGNSAVKQSYGNAGEHRVLGDGDVQNTNNSYGQISDQTLKQDIVDAASQWDDIKQVKVRKFRFKDNPTAPLQIGVVAQELETISPGLVKEVYENGDDGNKVKAVKYSVLYMKAIKALQEAMAKIETLETKVAALEGS